MRSISILASAMMGMMITSCGGGGGSAGLGPSAQDINNSLEATLQSVSGDWIGLATAPNGLRLDFKLQQGTNGQLSGTGTMKETPEAVAVPITVTGTFQRPLLTLTFDGMVYETRQVQGAAQGNYTTVGGIASTLKLTGTGYTRDIGILLQEK